MLKEKEANISGLASEVYVCVCYIWRRKNAVGIGGIVDRFFLTLVILCMRGKKTLVFIVSSV